MIGCKEDDFRGSAAMIRAHKRGQYAGKNPGRNILQTDRQTEK